MLLSYVIVQGREDYLSICGIIIRIMNISCIPVGELAIAQSKR